jgi:hypothetical protein
MDSKSVFLSIVYLVLGVFLLSLFVSYFLSVFSPRSPPSVIYAVQQPYYRDGYPMWHYGSGLPGMKPPKPSPPQQPPPPPPPPQQPPPPPPAQP